MSKRILIPTDFSVESLNTLRKALDSLGDTEVVVILMHSEYLSDSITELLFYDPEVKRRAMITPAFQEAINILKNKYDSIFTDMRIECFHGYGVSAFKNFVEGQKIDIIFIPKSYTLQPPKNGFDPIPIIKRSKLTSYEMDWPKSNDISDVQHLASLFN